MPYTKQDVLDKIQDISTNLQSCLTAVAAKGVTVPADSSLDDLGSLIRQIPDASYPDYDLPWIMNDGNSAYMFPETVASTVSVQVDCELVPVGSSYKYITGNPTCIFGLLYTDSSIRARRQMIKNPTSSSPTLDNTNSAEKAWTGYPFYKRQTLQCSYYSSSGYRSSLLYNGSWTHAASSRAQSSGSNYPNQPVTLFSGINFMNNASSFPFGKLPAGAKVYELDRAPRAYNSTDEWTSVFTPVLHWDTNRKEYRPTFVKKSNMNYASFPKPSVYRDDGTAYYIDVTKGLAEKTGYSQYTRYAYTDIPNSSTYSYVLKVYSTRRNGGDAVDYITAYDTSNGYTMRIGNNISSAYMKFQKNESYDGTNYTTNTGVPGTSGNFIIGVDFANNSMFYTTDSLTSGKSDYTITKPSVSDDVRGKICLVKPHSTTFNDALYSVMIYEGDTLIHYLVYCSMPGKSNGVFYDCVTKKTYDIQ